MEGGGGATGFGEEGSLELGGTEKQERKGLNWKEGKGPLILGRRGHLGGWGHWNWRRGH